MKKIKHISVPVFVTSTNKDQIDSGHLEVRKLLDEGWRKTKVTAGNEFAVITFEKEVDE